MDLEIPEEAVIIPVSHRFIKISVVGVLAAAMSVSGTMIYQAHEIGAWMGAKDTQVAQLVEDVGEIRKDISALQILAASDLKAKVTAIEVQIAEGWLPKAQEQIQDLRQEVIKLQMQQQRSGDVTQSSRDRSNGS